MMKLFELIERKKTTRNVKKKDKDVNDGSNAQNLVAKHSRTFNKAATHRDRKNDYQRKSKHSKNTDY